MATETAVNSENADYSRKTSPDISEELDVLIEQMQDRLKKMDVNSDIVQYTSKDFVDETYKPKQDTASELEEDFADINLNNKSEVESLINHCVYGAEHSPYLEKSNTDKYLVNIKYNILEEKPYSAARSQLENEAAEKYVRQPEEKKVYLKPVPVIKHPIPKKDKILKDFKEVKVPEQKPFYKRIFDCGKKLYSRISGWFK